MLHKIRRLLLAFVLAGALYPSSFTSGSGFLTVQPALAAGFVDFESGVDGAVILETIPGIKFTNTNGQDWIYGDWTTNKYNGKYPQRCCYTSNGNFFAWLGSTQGNGRITFTEPATYLSVWVSAGSPVTLTGYAEGGAILDTAQLASGNLSTGTMAELRIDATSGTPFKYAEVSGTANRWLIDDLSTDAAGVPNSRIPLIFIPGVAGTKLFNNSDGKERELWPNTNDLALPLGDGFLRFLRLNEHGNGPLEPENPDYNTVHIGGIITTEQFYGFSDPVDYYSSTLAYLNTRGYTETAALAADRMLYVMPYDWRKDLNSQTATLDNLIRDILEKDHPGVTQVNIIGHSMGGLIARSYISDPSRAAKVKTLVTLGTPYLGSTKPLAVTLYHNGPCFIEIPLGPIRYCMTNVGTIHDLLQNFPSAYQLMPTSAYYDITGNQVLNVDHDRNGDGQRDGWQTYSDVQTRLIWEHNFFLPGDAQRFHQNLQGYTGGTNGVAVYAFVGQATGTIGKIREYRRYVGRGGFALSYDLTLVAGDDAVPLDSADMGRRSVATDHSGGVSVYYTNLTHQGLAQYTSTGVGVLPQVLDILETGTGPTSAALPAMSAPTSTDPETDLLISGSAPLDRAQYTPISTEPTPLSGYQFLFQGDANVIATDALGNQTGKTSPEVFEIAIPGSSLDTLGDATSLFLPVTGAYTITMAGTTDSLADIRFRHIVNGAVVDTVLYKDLDVTSASLATLHFDGSNPDYVLQLDQNGDGSPEDTREPDTFLNATQSQDLTPPTTQIQIQGTVGPRGWYTGPVTVSAQATDNVGGSGIMRIEYSLDGGRTMLPYTGPITVDSSTTTAVVFLAIDVAGNTEPGFTVAVTGPYRIQLPLVRR